MNIVYGDIKDLTDSNLNKVLWIAIESCDSELIKKIKAEYSRRNKYK